MALDEPVSSATPSSILKDLVSSDPDLRTNAVSSLRLFLSRRTAFSDLDLLKLWKGLFFSMWMCDGPRNQQTLARELAGFVNGGVLDRLNALPYVDAFWVTLAREWEGIDVYRMDKYLYLARQVLLESFVFVAPGSGSRKEEVEELVAILTRTPLNVVDSKIPNGLRYHVLDIYADELEHLRERHGKDADQAGFVLFVEEILEPVRQLKHSALKSMRKKAAEILEGEELKNLLEDQPHAENGAEDDEWAGFGD